MLLSRTVNNRAPNLRLLTWLRNNSDMKQDTMIPFQPWRLRCSEGPAIADATAERTATGASVIKYLRKTQESQDRQETACLGIKTENAAGFGQKMGVWNDIQWL